MLTDSSSPAASLAPAGALDRAAHTATLLHDGRVLLAGGQGSSGALASAVLYDPKTGALAATGSMAVAREGHTATLLLDGRVLITGGSAPFGEDPHLASAEIYDPTTGTFMATGSMNVARSSHTATLLKDGRVLITGCVLLDTWDVSNCDSAELFDPTTGTFTLTGSMTDARLRPTATLLPDGRVLIVGGSWSQSIFASAELYDPETGKFSATGSMASRRAGHTATLLSDGRVLIAGGGNLSSYLASAEVYDPETGKFSATGSMASMRDNHTATLLSDGRVLVAGGEETDTGPGCRGSAELYDPATGRFKAAGSMSTSRTDHSAIRLQDGRVLMAGGQSCHASPLAPAELYDPATDTFDPVS